MVVELDVEKLREIAQTIRNAITAHQMMAEHLEEVWTVLASLKERKSE